MKLKYYLRGLGIGIFVTAIITSVSFQNRKPMTDEEVKRRAAELGMIENSVLTNIADKENESSEDKEQNVTQDELKDDEIKVDESNTENSDENTVTITVVSGDSSWTVSKRMEEAGLIESAKDFDTHLCRYGYDKKISVGSYKIPVTATHEEMAKILTRMD